jgi:hypothetical protein
MSAQPQLSATSCAEDGSLGLFFLAPLVLVVVQCVGLDVEGLGGSMGPGLFGLGLVTVLPLPLPPTSPLLAPFAKGHWWCFAFLWDANLHLHHSHFHCGKPSTASVAVAQAGHF